MTLTVDTLNFGDYATTLVKLPNGFELELWEDGHYQLWRDDELIVEGDNVSDTLLDYGSNTTDYRHKRLPMH